jgi:signal-transduction protein with cAMP-binding, CBS, and nucleotidyltransferase domain
MPIHGLAKLRTVRDIMTKRPVAVDYDTPVLEALKRMLQRHVGHLVIQRNGEYANLLSDRDVLRLVPEMMEQLNAASAGSIAASHSFTISPGTGIRGAAKLMLSEKAKLLLVSTKPVGVLTASDLAYSLPLTGGPQPDLTSTMTWEVERVDYATPLEDVMRLMREKRVGSILVTRHGRRYGIFTERDLLPVLTAKSPDLRAPVGKHCSRPVIVAPLKSTVEEAVSLMKKNKIKRLPLTKGGKIVGVVTVRDIVEAYTKL